MSDKTPTKSEKDAAALKDANVEAKSLSAKNKVVKDEDVVLFVSTGEENAAFKIRAGGLEIRGIRNSDNKGLVFRVPKSVADYFAKHEFVLNGRLVKAKD